MSEGKKPDFDVFAIREREGGKDVFTKVGVAFKRQGGEGVSILLDALPLGRRLAVLPPLPPHEDENVSRIPPSRR